VAERERGVTINVQRREIGTVDAQEIEELSMQVREKKHCQCKREKGERLLMPERQRERRPMLHERKRDERPMM